MALFNSNSSDSLLPLLTQFYQAETDADFQEVSKRFSVDFREPEDLTEMDLAYLKQIHKEVKEFLFAFASRGADRKVSAGVLKTIGDLITTLGSREAYFAEDPAGEIPPVSSMPPDEILDLDNVLWFWKLGDNLMNDLSISVAQELLALISVKIRVGICEECKNVFVIQKHGQQYCSQRCRARVGSRRRYAQLFDDHHSKKNSKMGV